MKWEDYAYIFSYLLGIVLVIFFTEQAEGTRIIACFTLTSGAALLLYHHRRTPFLLLLLLGLFCRILCFFHLPELSDDYYRFIWDGYVFNQGMSPFTSLPAQLPHNNSYTSLLYSRMNSPMYYSVYPPFLQYLFSLCQFLSGDSILLNVLYLRIVYLIAEIGSLFLGLRLLKYLSLRKWNILLYWLNPLVIIEIVGNLHPEGLVVPFLFAALVLIYRMRLFPSGIAWGIAIGIKLNPVLLALPFVKAINKRWQIIGGIISIFSLTVVGLYAMDAFPGMLDSLNLYFRKFEFNASLYVLLRSIAYAMYGYNMIHFIGPLLAIIYILICGMFLLSFKRDKYSLQQLISMSIFLWIFYLVCSTTVHPWYIIPIIALSIFTDLKTPLVWSFLIIFSYMHYSGLSAIYSHLLIFIEYLLMFIVLILDLKRFYSDNTLNYTDNQDRI